MIKRTTGRLLLTLLVTTGLAGTINNSSLSLKERKQAIHLIKSSRSEVLNSTQGLSAAQLKFKPSPKELSIGELIMNMALKEKIAGEQIKTIMDRPANAENRLKIALTDEQLLANNNYSLYQPEVPADNKALWKNPAEALKKYTALQNDHIKYIRTSTEDLRNHVVQTPAGWIDCYQYYLLLADQNSYYAEKINKIKSSQGFPKK
jgi:DinB superfamily